VRRHAEADRGRALPPVPAAWFFVLAALAVDLVGTRWISYLPGAIPGRYLPETLLIVGCALGGLSRRPVVAQRHLNAATDGRV